MLTAEEPYVPVYNLAESSHDGSADFEIASIHGLTPKQHQLFYVPHRNNFYIMIFLKQGCGRHWIDMVPYKSTPNTFYFTTPQQVILKEEAQSLSSTYVCFTEDFLGIEENRLLKQLPIIQNYQNGHELALSAEDIVFVNDIMEKMLAEYKVQNGWRNGMLLAYLRVLLIYVSRLYAEQLPGNGQSPERELLKKFTDLIGDNFSLYHDVASYAAMLNLSAGHFSEVIKEQSGKTAIEHIHDRLMLEAKRMLFHSSHSIKEIAFMLGFEDAAYFNRFFKRLTLSTPLSYRTATREMYH